MPLDQGGILLLDEFDINLHPDILPHLVRLFEDSETNPRKAQLLFVTQNSEIMDYMSKHRTYLFNKEENESYCYRRDELDHNLVRSDRPVSPLYRAGRIGGVPRLCESRLHWENKRIGHGKNTVLEVYGHIPRNSNFTHPKHVPLDIEWARFRLESKSRLVGFVVNRDQSERFDLSMNVFYVVFLDAEHRFYKMA